MSFCSFTKEAVKNFSTDVDNYFITDFLPEADGDAVKVYLYGLYLCKNSEAEVSVSEFAEDLFMEEALVKELFRYWEDFDAVTIISDEPFTVKYLPLTSMGKPRKFKSGKYDDFNKSIQLLITDRMISTTEYTEYFAVMEDYGITQDAMLMIAKYCVDLKGGNIGGKYIVTVAKDLAARGITTASGLEAELSDYNMKIGELQRILSAMGLKRKPDIDDFNYYNKWTKEMMFSTESVTFTAKKLKIKSPAYLDKIISELYGAKIFQKKDIETYFTEKEELVELTKTLLRELSVYVEVVAPVVENYVNPWRALGFDNDTLIFLANYCFKRRKRSLEAMDDTVNLLYKKGLVTLSAIGDYIKNRAKEDEFIKEILSAAATDRLPNEWDRQTLSAWREWGFSDEMIIACASIARGKTNPIVYMNTILSNWKSKGVTTPDMIKEYDGAIRSSSQHTDNERHYTKEELNKLISDIDDVDF
ncbi:MAG: DnaD domain protein [Clostridia bacterium]|nr:DnaD domain protein [Clostridia bacterium]